MIRGVKALSEGGVYNPAGTKLKYPIDTGPINTAKGVMFGPGGFPETKDYYENNRRELSENQTKAYQQSANPEAMYRRTLLERELNSINDKIAKLNKDSSMTKEEKQKEYQKLNERRKKLRGAL
jgi:hypothetical protein